MVSTVAYLTSDPPNVGSTPGGDGPPPEVQGHEAQRVTQTPGWDIAHVRGKVSTRGDQRSAQGFSSKRKWSKSRQTVENREIINGALVG